MNEDETTTTEDHMISARPKLSTQKLSLGERSLGELVKLDLGRVPESQAVGDLAGDVFHHLFKTHPEPLPDEEVSSSRKINKRLLNWMTNLPNFEDSRRTTSGSLTSSRIAAPLVWESLTTEDAFQDSLKRQEEIEQKERDSQFAHLS